MPDSMLGISDDPVRFEEAIKAIRRRVPMTDDAFSALKMEELEFAFTVADVAELDMVVDVYEAIQKAVADGETLNDFKARVGEQLETAWGGEDPARVEQIFRTNTMSSYNTGRFEAATHPDVMDARPYWRFDGPNDSRTTKDICLPCIGVILPADHPWWRTHYGNLHHNCRHRVSSLTKAQAEREGITRSPPDVKVPDGFGRIPSSAAAKWEPASDEYPEDFRAALDDRLSE